MNGNGKDSKLYFSNELLAWFQRHKRDLPWRESKDAYRVWVSEIMLQQTRVDTVIPYYHRFMAKFPTLEALADAPEEDVLKAWEGLGYYSRARNLQTAVREVKELYGGKVPDDPQEIAGLRGVGPYTAGAILSIAYNKPEPAVDGNVMRVLSRYFLIEDDIMKPRTRVRMEELARELIPRGAAGDFNQALMELGALVCTPKSPHCLTCPVMEHCEGRLAGKELQLPVKKKAKPPRLEYRAVALVEGVGDLAGHVLLRKRPDDGLLARMWELPHVEVGEEPDDTLTGVWAQALVDGLAADGVHIRPVGRLSDQTHLFSHIRWELRVLRCRGEVGALSDGAAEYRWAPVGELGAYTFPKAFHLILHDAFG